jgi:hypothetical protein
MLSDAHCANHPSRPAEIVCARCGTFVCTGCIVSGELCAACKKRLLQEQTPWTPQEKARAVARRCMRWSQRLLTAVLVSSVVAVTLHLAVEGGAVPTAARPISQGILVLGAALGLVLVGLAGRGYRSSEGGRPGPAVPGIFSMGTALFLAVIGIAPVIAAVTLIR